MKQLLVLLSLVLATSSFAYPSDPSDFDDDEIESTEVSRIPENSVSTEAIDRCVATLKAGGVSVTINEGFRNKKNRLYKVIDARKVRYNVREPGVNCATAALAALETEDGTKFYGLHAIKLPENFSACSDAAPVKYYTESSCYLQP